MSSGMATEPGGVEVEDEVARLREENAELRRLLNKHQWAGLTPPGSAGAWPAGSGGAAPGGVGNPPRCAIAAALAAGGGWAAVPGSPGADKGGTHRPRAPGKPSTPPRGG